MKSHSLLSGLGVLAPLGFLLALYPHSVRGQITPDQETQIRSAIGDRVEALTILGGDYGLTGGAFRSTGTFQHSSSDVSLVASKLGGAGDIGAPQQLGNLDIGWQPRLQGNMGYIEATNHINSPLLEGDASQFRTVGLEFGGGARFWVNNAFSLAPTLLGIYGRTWNSYTANSAFMQANLPTATQLGLVGWTVDTATLVADMSAQYLVNWDRTIIKLTLTPTYYHTETVRSSSEHVSVHGDSSSFAFKVDVDVPLGVQIYGHELRTGGSYNRSYLFGGLRDGLREHHISEVHGRLVLDYLNQLWKVQWIGIGGSYVWGDNITGWTVGADVAFRL